jgi:hydroxymethylpyrimidine/phosphomethylpyrimidine kinase
MLRLVTGMPPNQQKPVVLTIAGFDPAAGSGVLADLKTFAAHECYGVAALTAITVQNTSEARRMAPVDADLIEQQIQVLFEDIAIAGVKAGLLGSRKNIEAVARCLAARREAPTVVDPVLRSSGGLEFAGKPEVESFKRTMLPLARILTPNAAAAERLLGIPVSTLEEMKGAAKLLFEQGPAHVVITGGHLERPADVYYDGRELEVFTGLRVESQNIHGAGSTFSAALLANLVQGKAVRESVVLAKAYVSQAISRAYQIGNGRGPLNHLFRFAEAAARPVIAAEPVPEPSHRQ